MKVLYALALFQLVAGPLVILQVSLLCRLTLHDVPRHGLSVALEKAWQSDEFQAVLADGGPRIAGGKSKAPAPAKEPQAEAGKDKSPALPWKISSFVNPPRPVLAGWRDAYRRWTPVWPQAPPGPPPRVA